MEKADNFLTPKYHRKFVEFTEGQESNETIKCRRKANLENVWMGAAI